MKNWRDFLLVLSGGGKRWQRNLFAVIAAMIGLLFIVSILPKG